MGEFFEIKHTHESVGLSIEGYRIRLDVSEARPTKPGKYQWHHAIVRLSVNDAEAMLQALNTALQPYRSRVR